MILFKSIIRYFTSQTITPIWLSRRPRIFNGYTNTPGNYPAVNQLVNLASLVKADLGTSVKVTYAADWSEYHHTDGGWYNLDPLWASPSIDMVGIDSYFPLTPDLAESQINEALIKEYWEKGEGWDYYYADAERTVQTPFTGFDYAWKNVEYWWTHNHINPNGSQTAWTSKMKPIWFTEFGFPSVDGCANQPNVFYDPSSVESYFPRGSKGRVDFQAQREALNATLDYLETRNQLPGNASRIPRRFVWTWDARPFPFWPDLAASVWKDNILWKTGHWINGKLGNSSLGAIVANLLQKIGLSSSDYDVSRLTDTVEGYVILSTLTVREALEQLQAAYFFDAVESDGQLKFVKRGGSSLLTIPTDRLVPLTKDGNIRDIVQIQRKQELDLPQAVNVTYINRTSNYDPATQLSQRQVTKAVNQAGINVPIVMSDQYGKTVADITLYNAWQERNSFKFSLPPYYAPLEPTDIITVIIDNVPTTMRITSTKLERYGLMEVTAIAEDAATYDFYTPPAERNPIEAIGTIISDTHMELLDIPAFPSDSTSSATLRVAATGLDNWKGSIIYRSDDGGQVGGNTFAPLMALSTPSTMGATLTTLPIGETNTFDRINTVDIQLYSGELNSRTELAILNGANVALLGNEIIQFQTAELIGNRRYRLSKLLRGRLGTEHETNNHHPNERFVLLSPDLGKTTLPHNLISQVRQYKAVSVGATLAVTDEKAFTYTGRALRPYSPVHVRAERHTPNTNDWTIRWVRRTRIGGEWRDAVDIPLSEESERYEVEILDGAIVRRVISSTTPQVTYTEAQQIEDFGLARDEITGVVYQMSVVVGRGIGKGFNANGS